MNQQYIEQATKTLEAFSKQLEQSPGYSSVMLMALNVWLGPTQEIVIAGETNAADTKQMLELVRGKFLPNAVVLFHGTDEAGETIEKVVPFLKGQVAIDGKATAYVCENYVCNQPVTTIEEFDKILAGSSGVDKK
jgi:uncharacterized protein YyaL (SSP411 family)